MLSVVCDNYSQITNRLLTNFVVYSRDLKWRNVE
jgi:hypothetical protein